MLSVYYVIGNAFAAIEMNYMLFTFDPATAELADANDELHSASSVTVEKTEAVYNSDEPGFKAEKQQPQTIAKKHEFKAKKSSVAQNHNVHSCKAVSPLAPKREPLIRVKGGMYSNTNDEFQRYDDPAGYCNKITYNPDGGPKRRGELVANYYGFAAF
ncbi:hypothetical protein GGF49_005005 [Coemansia sp. RSA 1853]|nr:hypothetical protein LPJ76_005111 [Coemansia sp. RSA 638]KAJ2539732.1 hypothetical protein GGF49_005005 [Coemansia sp. RSA 1853]